MRIGQAGGQCCTSPFGFQMGGLGFGSDGTLWANGFTLTNNSSHLFTLDLATGLASDVGAHGVNVGRGLRYSGLAFDDHGRLLSLGSIDAASGALYSVNTATGAATSLSGTGLPYGTGPIRFGVNGGLAFVPAAPVPEPETYAMLLAGLGLLGFTARRRKNRMA